LYPRTIRGMFGFVFGSWEDYRFHRTLTNPDESACRMGSRNGFTWVSLQFSPRRSYGQASILSPQSFLAFAPSLLREWAHRVPLRTDQGRTRGGRPAGGGAPDRPRAPRGSRLFVTHTVVGPDGDGLCFAKALIDRCHKTVQAINAPNGVFFLFSFFLRYFSSTQATAFLFPEIIFILRINTTAFSLYLSNNQTITNNKIPPECARRCPGLQPGEGA